MSDTCKTCERLTAELAHHKAAGAWCEKHQPNGGARAVCVICSGMKLSAALSRISYLCSEPNDMECSPYDVHCDEGAVVSQVTELVAERDRLLADDYMVITHTQKMLEAINDDLTAERDAALHLLAAWDEELRQMAAMRYRLLAALEEAEYVLRHAGCDTTAATCLAAIKAAE